MLLDLRSHVSQLQSALDVGCGVGNFCEFLTGLGLNVTGIDGRRENVLEASRRHPMITFHVQDIEDRTVVQLGTFDLVFCLGVLYHLENPLSALRNLWNLTGKVLVVETMIIPGDSPALLIGRDPDLANQGLLSAGLYPTQPALVVMLSHAGFPHCYHLVRSPLHEDFRGWPWSHCRRVIVLASRKPISIPTIRPVVWTSIDKDPWRTPLFPIASLMRRLGLSNRIPSVASTSTRISYPRFRRHT